jgi:hypothetical protein
MRHILLLVASILLAAGCSGSDEDPVARCRSRAPTITGGIYGCITATNDLGDTKTTAEEGFAVQVFTTQPSDDPHDGHAADASSLSDADGYYELSLAPGHYWICSAFRRCTEKQLVAGARRLDYSFSLAPGWEDGTPSP